MEFKNLLIETTEGVATLTINRPQALNALNSELLGELACALYQLEYDTAVKAIVLTGAGEKAFVAGADIKEMAAMSAYEGHRFAVKGQHVMMAMEKMKTPVIAAVNGFALGGGLELALGCDFIYASEKARLGFPEVTLGLIPGFGGTQPTLEHLELIFVGAAFHAVVGVLSFIQVGFLQGQIVLGFDDPIFRSGTLEEFGASAILIAFPGLDEIGADFGARDFLGVLEIGQIVIGFVEVFLGLLQINDGLRQICTGGVEQIVQRFLSGDEFQLRGGKLGIGGIAEADERLPLFDRLTFLSEDLADDAGGIEGDLGIPSGFQSAFGDDGAVGNHRGNGSRRSGRGFPAC